MGSHCCYDLEWPQWPLSNIDNSSSHLLNDYDVPVTMPASLHMSPDSFIKSTRQVPLVLPHGIDEKTSKRSKSHLSKAKGMNRDSNVGGSDPNCSILPLKGLVHLSLHPTGSSLLLQGHSELHTADWKQATEDRPLISPAQSSGSSPEPQTPPRKHLPWCPRNLSPCHCFQTERAASDLCQLPSLRKVVPRIGACDDGCSQYRGKILPVPLRRFANKLGQQDTVIRPSSPDGAGRSAGAGSGS